MTNFFPGNPPQLFHKSQSNRSCCGCGDCNGVCHCYSVSVLPSTQVRYVDCNGANQQFVAQYPVVYTFCATPDTVRFISYQSNPVLSFSDNGPCANIDCTTLQNSLCYCFQFGAENPGTITYYDCNGDQQTVAFPGMDIIYLCTNYAGPTFDGGEHTITYLGVCGAPDSLCNQQG